MFFLRQIVKLTRFRAIHLTINIDYGLIVWKMHMKEVAVSEFKAKCLALLQQVQKTKKPIRVTRFGKPVAEIVPPSAESPKDWLGSMKREIEIVGDIVSPANVPEDWETLRD
jgi:prevent-host-death family protein